MNDRWDEDAPNGAVSPLIAQDEASDAAPDGAGSVEDESKPDSLSFAQRFRRDVWDQPTIQPLGGFLLSALFLLVAGLTWFYAPSAFTSDESTPFSRGVIPVEWGYATIVIVSIIALGMAFEPSLRRRRFLSGANGDQPRSWLGRAWRGFAHLWSFIDFVFADILARIAGATWGSVTLRYAHGAAWIIIAAFAGLTLAAPLGLTVILFTLALIVGVARRWSWVEADRNRYMIERGRRRSAELAGFANDLRDEALIGVICLFLLTPLALSQVQSWTCATGACAFTFEGGFALPDEPLARWWTWLGFFGVELAKALPFVDWSEVFRVENESPIEAANAFGAQVVFFTRAALDLLLLAAVLQAVQVAGQLRAQREAFDAKELPVLEPFEQAVEFERLRRSAPLALELEPSQQPALAAIGHYDPKTLGQIVEDAEGSSRDVRQLAAAALMRQSQLRERESGAPQIDAFFTKALATAELDDASRRWLARVATMAEPEPASEELRGELPVLLADAGRDWRVRAAAARALGRGSTTHDGGERLVDIASDATAPIKLRADAGLALVKLKQEPARAAVTTVAESLAGARLEKPDEREALISTAHALALLGDPLSDVNARLKSGAWDGNVRLVERGWRIQVAPMAPDEARKTEIGDTWDQLVRIAPGKEPFPETYLMGAAKPESPNFYPPQREVRMVEQIAVGRFSVTYSEWRGFRETFGLDEGPTVAGNREFLESNGGIDRLPAFDLSWRDANSYCAWLSRITGEPWRLLREAEWEYACRAGKDTAYAWGDDRPEQSQANYQGTFDRPIPVEGHGDARDGASVNDWGLWQMHGNVAEWCQDPWTDDVAGNPRASNDACASGDYSRAVLRGGSWVNVPQDLRSAIRDGVTRGGRGSGVGFRVSRTLRGR